jgi:hypothetical protein
MFQNKSIDEKKNQANQKVGIERKRNQIADGEENWEGGGRAYNRRT